MKRRPSVLLFLAGLCSLACCLPQYRFIGTTLSWLKAQAYCREQSTDLATIFNIEDMNRLVNTAQDSTGGFTEKAWIGLRDNLTSWRWSFSNSSYYEDQEGDYRNWYYGQPDNFLGDQMCVTMWSGGVWQDSQCSLRNPFICYDGSKIPDLPFIFVEQELSWSGAQLYCRKYHTDLASVRNERENKEIQLLANNKSVWIGLYRTREWSDKSDSNYRYWQRGQPDNAGGTQECVATDLGNGGLWSDEECKRELRFICYRDSVLSTTTTTTETPNKITTTEGASTTTKTTPNEIPDKPVLPTSTTTETPNKTTTIEGHSSSPEMTSSEQPSTLQVDQTTSIPVIPDQRTTTETETTTSHLSTAITSSEHPSTPEVYQTIASTVTTSTSSKLTTIEGDLRRTEMTSSEQPSTTLVDQTTSIPEVSSQQYSTPEGGQTSSKEHVINMRVKFTSKVELSEDDIEKLFHDLVIEMGLPTSIKVGLKRSPKK